MAYSTQMTTNSWEMSSPSAMLLPTRRAAVSSARPGERAPELIGRFRFSG